LYLRYVHGCGFEPQPYTGLIEQESA